VDPQGVSVTFQAVEQMSGDVTYMDELLRVSENRAGVVQRGEPADGYWMINGDVQVIVALLLMVHGHAASRLTYTVAPSTATRSPASSAPWSRSIAASRILSGEVGAMAAAHRT
jgi:hypothetical protein